MAFDQIKYDGKEVQLTWRTVKGQRAVAHHMTSKESPDPEFIKAMRDFVPQVIDLLELPESWEPQLSVTGITMNMEEKDGRRGVVITARRPVPDCNNLPLILNVPHLREPLKPEEHDKPGFYNETVAQLLTNLQDAALRFKSGERAQTSMELEEAK